jgi:non-ribosomal peptide synthetase component E (peptide arylation enzyme)
MNRADAVEAHLGVKAANLYGITEGLVMISSPDDPPEARHGTNGRPCLPTDDVRVLNLSDGSWCGHGELGELVFRGSSSLTGYFNAPDLTAETLSQDGYVRTGDLVRSHQIDGKTYFSFEGRLKDNINRGGEKYGTEEVETLVRSHPAVADVAVVAMPDPVLFERACAWIIPRPGHLVPDVPSLGQHLIAKGLAKFKLPERIETIESFPVTRVGKLDKAKLREMVRNKLADEAVALTTRT